MKNVLITGCAGFIGSHTVEVFLKDNYNVVGVDCLTYAASEKNMSSFIDRITFYKEDIANREKIDQIVKFHNIDCIINFAAETHVDNSIDCALPFIHSNIKGVYSLLSVCRDNNCSILQISTDEVYGSKPEGSFTEEDILEPKNPYSATKAAAEHFIASFHNTYGVDYKIVRMSNNFGPRQHQEKFIPTIIRSLRQGKKIPIYGDGKNVRDWYYVKDCAQSILDVYRKGKVNSTYNLSLQNEMQNVQIVKYILEIMGLSFEDNVIFVEDRLGHDFRYSIDNKKLINLNNQKPSDFKTCLIETINYDKYE